MAGRGTGGTAEPAPRSVAAAWAAWAAVPVCVVTALVGFWWAARSGVVAPWRLLVIPVIWSVPAAMIAASRPRAALGWLHLSVAVLFSASGLAAAWLATQPVTASEGAAWALWFVDRGGAVLVPLVTLALVLLPDSRLPSVRWRLPVALAVAMQLVLIGLWSFSRTPASSPDSAWSPALAALDNPLGLFPADAAARADSVVWLLQLPLLLAVAGMVVRLRRSSGPERQGLAVLLLGLVVLVAVMLSSRAMLGPYADAVDVVAGLLMATVLVSAVLRRHLEGVTVVVHHAFVLTALGAAVAGVYVLAVGLLASVGPDVSRFGGGVVAALAALAVHPLRARLLRVVDRLMRGDRRDPFGAVSRLADSAHRAPSLPEVLAGVAASVAASLRLPGVRVQAFGVLGHWPAQDPGANGADAPLDDVRAVRVPLVAGDREVGSLVAVPQPGRRLRDDERKLLEQLGRHAGVAVDAVHLAEQVARHHRTLVTAREEERRRLGRELHDDLGPTVAGLSMQLGALRPLVRTDPDAVVARLARLEEAAAGALVDIRRVAHELRPPVLDQVGLGRAVQQVAESLDLVLTELTVELDALPAAVELAAYRIAAEALTNVARHAGTRSVRLVLRTLGDSLVLTVADDGVGPAGRDGDGRTAVGGPGLGSTTMRERAEELGGTLTVRPGEDRGTVVTAVLPLSTTGRTAVPQGST